MVIRTFGMDIVLKVVAAKAVHILNLSRCSFITSDATSITFMFAASSIKFNFRNSQLMLDAYRDLERILVGESKSYEWRVDAEVVVSEM